MKTNIKVLSTSETATVDNYPYGYLKTTATFSTEFKPGKGFRSVFQTVNPKTGRINTPKKGTYHPVILLTQSETGYVSHIHLAFYGEEGINEDCKTMNQYFDLFTPEQIKHVYSHILMTIKAGFIAIVQYCGADPEKVKPILEPAIKTTVEAIKNGGNYFDRIKIDVEALNACKVPDFNPFRVTEYADVVTNRLNNPVVKQISDHDKRNGETLETVQAEESAKAVIRETGLKTV